MQRYQKNVVQDRLSKPVIYCPHWFESSVKVAGRQFVGASLMVDGPPTWNDRPPQRDHRRRLVGGPCDLCFTANLRRKSIVPWCHSSSHFSVDRNGQVAYRRDHTGSQIPRNPEFSSQNWRGY